MNTRGFTLIEVIIYLALFGLLIGGAVIAAYNVFESSGRGSTHAILQQEGDFIAAKISWALSGARAIASPAITTAPCSALSSSLSVTKWDASVGTVTIAHSGSNVTISRGGAAAVPINSSEVEVSTLSIQHCWQGGAAPESVTSKFTVNMRMPNGMVVSQNFSSTDYVRR